MKTILVPTDFSDNAHNAIDYAVEIAKASNAKIILFHAFHVPTVPADVPFIMPLDELEKDSLEGLEKIKKNILLNQANELDIVCETKLGFAVDEINGMIEEKSIDLVILGMRGAGYLSEKLIGSITTTLMRKAKCPVLAINENVKFKSIKNIVLACDYQKIENENVLNPLKEFVKLFNSHIYILNVTRELETAYSTGKTEEDTQLENYLEGFDHSFKVVENEDIIDGINEFVNSNEVDMIAMITHKHTLLETIFQERNTKRMAFHTQVPILALHQ